MSRRPTISTIVITKNEADNIEECLKSVAWTDEIIVLDSGSTDGTIEIARKYTDKVFETDWPGFGPQKNRALSKASSDWILSIDADERVTPDLKEEIARAINSNEFEGYEIPRLSSFCGQEIKHSGWWPDYILRLFKRDSARFSDSAVHERVILNTQPGKLEAWLVHFNFNDIETLVDKMNHYSSLSASDKFQAGKSGGMIIAVFRALWMFIRTYFLKLGFLDGKAGFIIAVSAAEGSYYRYIKLMYLANRSDPRC